MNTTTPKASLGAGSYDYDKLKEATDAVAVGQHKTAGAAQAAMDQAVADADASKGKAGDPREIPGYSWRTRDRKIGDATVKERIQVADGDDSVAVAGDAQEAVALDPIPVPAEPEKPRGRRGDQA